MEKNAFDVGTFWKNRVEGITDKEVLRKAYADFESATKGRNLNEGEYATLMYLKSRV